MNLLALLSLLSAVMVVFGHPLDASVGGTKIGERAPLAIDYVNQHIHPSSPRPVNSPLTPKFAPGRLQAAFGGIDVGKWLRRSELLGGIKSIEAQNSNPDMAPTAPEDTTSEPPHAPSDQKDAEVKVWNKHGGRKYHGHNKKRGARAPDYKTTSVDGSSPNEVSTQDPQPTSSPV